MGAKTSDAEEFTNVPLRQGRSHVLQRDIGVDKVYGRISQYCEVGRDIVHVFTSARELVELSGSVNHGRRNIDSNDPIKMHGKCLTQTAHAASEVYSSREANRRQLSSDSKNFFDLRHAGSKKLGLIPRSGAFARTRENYGKWISLA